MIQDMWTAKNYLFKTSKVETFTVERQNRWCVCRGWVGGHWVQLCKQELKEAAENDHIDAFLLLLPLSMIEQ